MINKLDEFNLKSSLMSVYDYDVYTINELLCEFFDRINECIDVTDKSADIILYLKEKGLNEEVIKEITKVIENGTIENLINDKLFNGLNDELDILEHKIDVYKASEFNILGDGSDETDKVNNLFNDKDNCTIIFDVNCETIMIRRGVTLQNKKNITIEGNGVTIKFFDDVPDNNYTLFPNDFGGNSILRLLECDNIKINNLCFHGGLDNRTPLSSAESQDCCLLLLSCNNIDITKCVFMYGMTDGVHLFRSATTTNKENKNILIENCYFYANRRNNLSIVEGDNVVVQNNTFDGSGLVKGTLPMSNVCVEPDNVSMSGYSPCKNVFIKNNIIKNAIKYNVMISGFNAKNINVDNNIIEGSKDVGVFIRSYSGANVECYVTNNNITNCVGGVTSTYGNLKLLQDNTIDGCNGTAFVGFDIHSLQIMDNEIIFNAGGITLTGTECYIKNNIIKDNVTDTSLLNGSNYSINIVSNIATSNFQISNNYVVNSNSNYKMQNITVTNPCKGVASCNTYINPPDQWGVVGIIGVSNHID